MSVNLRREVEQLLAHMPDNSFLQSLINRLRLGMDLRPSDLTALKKMSSRMVVQRALIERDKARARALKAQDEALFSAEDINSSKLEKKASVSRAWDYDRGEWAYRVDGGNVKYASEEVLDYKVEWGDPPKPNMWKARVEGRMQDGRIKVTSPSIVGEIVFEIYPKAIRILYQSSSSFVYQIKRIRRHDGMEGILSHATYVKHIKPAILKGTIELSNPNMKVASEGEKK